MTAITNSQHIDRRELFRIAQVAVPFVLGIHCWPRRRATVRLRVGVAASLRKEWFTYFGMVNRWIEAVVAPLGRRLVLEIGELNHIEARKQYLSPKTDYDIVMIDEPWLAEFRDSAVYFREPTPILSNAMVLVLNARHLPDVSAQELMSTRRGRRPALSASSPHALANLLLQHESLMGATLGEPATVNSLRASVAQIRALSVTDPVFTDPLTALHVVASGEAGWTLSWLSQLGIMASADLGQAALTHLRALPLPGGISGAMYLAVRKTSPHRDLAELVVRTIANACDPGLLRQVGHLPSWNRLASTISPTSESGWVGLPHGCGNWDVGSLKKVLTEAAPRFGTQQGFADFAEGLWRHFA
jgi:hypothetical protein